MNLFEEFFSSAPDTIDVDKIRQQWQALSPLYDVEHWQLPLPIWAERPFEHDGTQAWEKVKQYAGTASRDRPVCIYIHIPFCTSKCGFCDSYSFKLGSHVTNQVNQYIERLCYELDLWSQLGNLSQRPISTVHLGGGTPTFLDEHSLQRLTACVWDRFNVSNQTEWALESSVESLTNTMTSCLHHLGFQRLHVGVQSLQPMTRQIIGRRHPVRDVLDCISRHLANGWVVSVDLICGLPEQTLQGFLSDIQILINTGVDGFSLYELLIYPQNRKWAAQIGLLDRSHIPNYFLFQAGGNLLSESGYRKNLFNHWAKKRDKNIYFTYPMRGEDLLAIGTIANGVFGCYHYRHPRYADYLRGTKNGSPGLEGGLLESFRERNLRPITTAILSSMISHQKHHEMLSKWGNGNLIWKRWLDHALIEPGDEDGYQLTNNGAWLAGNMLGEISQLQLL